MELPDILLLKLSVQRGMLGRVTGNLAAVCASLSERSIIVKMYFFNDMAEDEYDDLDSMGGEILADFAEGYTIDMQFEPIGKFSQSSAEALLFMRGEAEKIVG